MKLVLSVLLVAQSNVISASFCGESSIPFSFEAQPNGQPILGCARPTCFGWTADGEPISRNAQFHRVLKVPDGFQRKSSEKPRKMNRIDRELYKEQSAVCETTYESESCLRTDQWVGGIGPMYNATILPLALQCCTYDFLRESSTDRGVAIVNPGQIVVGGEVLKNGRQYAFDYIADVLKMRSEDDSVSYDVTIRRFLCLPIPDEPSTPVDETVLAEITDKFEPIDSDAIVAVPKKVDRVAFQAPIQEAEPIPLQQVTLPPQVQAIPPTQPPSADLLPPAPPNVAQPSAFAAPETDSAGSAEPVYPAYGRSGSNCFSGDTTVRTFDGKDVQLRDVNLSDWVMTKYMDQIVYTQITSWLHRLPDKEVEFYRIVLKDGSQLKLTAKHYIYKTICDQSFEGVIDLESMESKAEWAENLKIGDCLYRVKDMEENPHFVKAEIIGVERITEKGIYAPMTSTGDIIVNGIHASCHNIVHSHSIQSSFFQAAEHIADWFSSTSGLQKTIIHKDVPHGLELITAMLDLVLPSDLHTL